MRLCSRKVHKLYENFLDETKYVIHYKTKWSLAVAHAL